MTVTTEIQIVSIFCNTVWPLKLSAVPLFMVASCNPAPYKKMQIWGWEGRQQSLVVCRTTGRRKWLRKPEDCCKKWSRLRPLEDFRCVCECTNTCHPTSPTIIHVSSQWHHFIACFKWRTNSSGTNMISTHTLKCLLLKAWESWLWQTQSPTCRIIL